jgi:hypothetical protein
MFRPTVLSCALGVLLVHGDAWAQQPPPAKPPSQSSTQFTLRRDEAGGVEAQAARGRAKAGDCAGALPSFDTAIKATVEPTLRRDRGLCHEKLGNTYPAIEDFRAYLAARPEAPDAELIRERLTALEAKAGVGGPSSQSKQARPASKDKSSAPPDSGTGYDEAASQEKLADAAESSPLRNGTGVVLGPFVHIPRYYLGDKANDELGYGVGAAFRYSTGATLSLISEVGYTGIGTSGASSSQAGPLLLGGAEIRLALSQYASDHILLRGGIGYERFVVSGTRAVNNNLLARFGLGYRHVFGPSIGIEALVDGGPAYVMPESGDSRLNATIGGSVAFLVGF